jgi:SAM-dependent methyltransferase
MSKIPLSPIDGRGFAAAQAFTLGAKMYWTTRLHPALRAEYEAKAAAAKRKPKTVDDVHALIGDSVLYRYHGWLERHLQRMKYSARYGLLPWHEQRRAELEGALDGGDLPAGMLTLDPALATPDYFAAVDIHHHEEGIYSDPIAGFVYERGARTTTPMLSAHKDLHHRLTAWVAEQGGTPRRMVDLGCGFGKSTAPFYAEFRDAEVVGVDIAAPCLKLAAHDAARAQARNVSFRQAKAEATGLPAGRYDLVTSTMLLHEMTPRAVERSLDEAHRLLAPGGRLVHLDFWHLKDPFDRFVHYSHGWRNNEPYMEPVAEMDLPGALKKRGFKNVRILPFAESEGALDPGNTAWRFPWTVIAAERA